MQIRNKIIRLIVEVEIYRDEVGNCWLIKAAPPEHEETDELLKKCLFTNALM